MSARRVWNASNRQANSGRRRQAASKPIARKRLSVLILPQMHVQLFASRGCRPVLGPSVSTRCAGTARAPGVLSPCCGAGERALGSMKILDLPSRSLGLPSRRVEAGAAAAPRRVHDVAPDGARAKEVITRGAAIVLKRTKRNWVCTSLGQRPARRMTRGWPRAGQANGQPLSRLWVLHGGRGASLGNRGRSGLQALNRSNRAIPGRAGSHDARVVASRRSLQMEPRQGATVMRSDGGSRRRSFALNNRDFA